MRVLVAGPAKSGTTAVFYAIARSLQEPALFFEESLSKLRDLPDQVAAKVIFETESEAALQAAGMLFDRRIAIIRDPRDNLVSRVLYAVADRRDLLRDNRKIDAFLAALERKQQAPKDADLLYLVRLLYPDTDRLIAEIIKYSRRIGRFIAEHKDDWFALRYEDFVAGSVGELSKYLGVSIDHRITVDKEYQRVARTRSSGDWRNWFTDTDVRLLRSRFQSVMTELGYAADWALSATPTIAPEHGAAYVRRLVDERRHHFGLDGAIRADDDIPTSSTPGIPTEVCNICGGKQFAPGPIGRLADSGILPCCHECGSLERQRVVRSVFQAFPIGFLDWRRVLQFSPDRGLNPLWFRQFEISVFGGENSLDIQAIAKPDASYDLVSLNHVLEFVPDDRKGFSELARVLSPRGVMQVCFSAPLSRDESQDFKEPFGAHQAWHLYGRDLAARFRCAEAGLTVVGVQEVDRCTGVREMVHLFFKDAADARRARSWLAAWTPSAYLT